MITAVVCTIIKPTESHASQCVTYLFKFSNKTVAFFRTFTLKTTKIVDGWGSDYAYNALLAPLA